MRDTWRSGGITAVDALYDAVPESAFEVIGGFGHPNPTGGWIDDLGEVALPISPPAFVRVDWDRFGGWILDAFCAREGISSEFCPGRLRDDAFTVLADLVDGATAAFWRLRFETVGAADGFARAIPALYTVQQAGRDVILTRVSPPERAAEFASVTWTAVPVIEPDPQPAPGQRILCPRKQPGPDRSARYWRAP